MFVSLRPRGGTADTKKAQQEIDYYSKRADERAQEICMAIIHTEAVKRERPCIGP